MEIVRTKYGRIRGVQKGKYTFFGGIPYAAPPVGELRFRKPREVESWEGIYEANAFPARPIQEEPLENSFYYKEFYGEPLYDTAQSEDCLYLNIWTPSENAGEKRPVAFWIHGGGFSHGYGHEKEFDGEEFCKRGVILVTINYRLGIFGFLAHPWLSEESGGISGNYGIFDQIAALKWTYENISAFGGDPENITVFGQSAGSLGVQTLVSSNLTGNMISKAIMQSAGGYKNHVCPNRTLKDMEEFGCRILQRMEIASLKELRETEGKKLQKKWSVYEKEFVRDYNGMVMAPCQDGVLLNGDFDSLVENGTVKDIPYMLGSTSNDIKLQGDSQIAPGKGTLQRGCAKWSLMQEKLGRKASYVYYFDGVLKGDHAGAFHSSELWYMFGTLERSWRPKTEGDYRLSNIMLDYWTDFMKTGAPRTEEGKWPPYTKENAYIEILCEQES